MGILKNIFWQNNSKDTIVYKFDMKNDYISKGSMLTVREGQAAVFCHRGKMADVFLPGSYKLDTDSVPFLTKLMSWKYGFENPFRSDVFFVNTTQFTNQKWGTTNPIIVSDKNFGAVRIRGFGTYAFRVSDAFVFLTELSGTQSTYKTEDIVSYLRSMIVMGISDAIGESKLSVVEMAANLIELSKGVEQTLCKELESIGIVLTKFNFENFSLPKELEDTLDKNTGLGMMRGNMDVYTQMAQADALKAAAANPGTAGSTMGAGLGLGMGAAMGNMFGSNMTAPKKAATVKCSACNASMPEDAKFCPECGAPAGMVCPNCKKVVKQGRFCPECGSPLKNTCSKCKAELAPNAKFCPECGEKQ